jgi:hypothetical protein
MTQKTKYACEILSTTVIQNKKVQEADEKQSSIRKDLIQ